MAEPVPSGAPSGPAPPPALTLRLGGYVLELATRADLRSRALRLRREVFRGGRGPEEIDRDCHDDAYGHLVIREPGAGRDAGCCRLGLFAHPEALARGYAGAFYDLSPLAALAGPVLELGRFCVAPGAPAPDVLRLTLAALALVVDETGARMIAGCASFTGADAERHGPGLAELARAHVGPAHLVPGRRAARTVPLARAAARHAPDPGALPPLLRSYLGLGGWVGDHAVIDHDLDTLHVFVAVPVQAIPAARKAALRRLYNARRGD